MTDPILTAASIGDSPGNSIDPFSPPSHHRGRTSPGDLALADANGDAAIDIADPIAILGFLYRDAAPPALGTACLPISGCERTACE